jgi:hypothetical protein
VISYKNGDLIFSADATERVRFTSAGNVGIGTTGPQVKLHIEDSTPQLAIFGTNNNDNAASISLLENKEAGWANRYGFRLVYDGSNNDLNFEALEAGSVARIPVTIERAGNVGIGTTGPGQKLHVVGNTAITSGSLSVGTTTATDSGRILSTYLSSAYTRYVIAESNGAMTVDGVYDYAELVPLDSKDYEPGTLISSRPATSQEIEEELTNEPFIGTISSSAYDKQLIGVLSQPNTPAIGPRETAKNGIYRPLSLVGRTLVKVSTENGPIEAGDWLTSSSQPGVAMKATKAGMAIGKALESYDNPDPKAIGKILVFVNLGWYGGDIAQLEGTFNFNENGAGESEEASIFSTFVQKVKQALASLGLWIENGVVKVEKIFAKEIEVEKARFKKIEMVDQATGEIWCTWIENGEWKKKPGVCPDTLVSSDTSSNSSGAEISPIEIKEMVSTPAAEETTPAEGIQPIEIKELVPMPSDEVTTTAPETAAIENATPSADAVSEQPSTEQPTDPSSTADQSTEQSSAADQPAN